MRKDKVILYEEWLLFIAKAPMSKEDQERCMKEVEMMGTAPVITLQSGLRVANFSSPHPFTFTTGEVLPACTPERSRMLALEAVEEERPGIKGTIDIVLEFRLTTDVVMELLNVDADEGIDVVLVPLPVMQAARHLEAKDTRKLRVVRVADRVTKTIHPDRFCL